MLSRYAAIIWNAFVAAVGRLDKSLSPRDTFERLRKHRFTLADSIYIYHIANAILWFSLMKFPPFPLTVMIPILWVIGLIIPLTSQFLLPATPVLTWVLTFYASRFTPVHWRPNISVSLLPALEVVLYGANISDILTRFTHPLLDILAWLPYGVVHFTFPFVVAALLWLFRDKAVLHLWARAFGYMNLIGVLVQILMPCAAPWYELIYGLTPATYAIRGSPGGLARIDALFHSNGYATTFGSSPVVFGAFPSLHAGCATMEALFMSHFFPQCTRYIWTYVGVLYWATMYLTHHYLIDVVGGACLATMCFYLYLPDELRSTAAATAPPGGNNSRAGRLPRTKYDVYDLSPPRTGGIGEDFELSDESVSEDEEMDITYRAPNGRNANSIARPARIADVGALQRNEGGAPSGKKAQSHRHTASIASLIRSDERTDEGWSPINSAFSPAGR